MARTTDHLRGLSREDERRLERLFTDFESAWKSGPRPRVADFLPKEPPRTRRAALVELVLIDLEYGLKVDPYLRIESHLSEFPELAADPDVLVALAVQEYGVRGENGIEPSVQEYLSRFPSISRQLATRLGSWDGDGPSSASKTGSHPPREDVRPHDDSVPDALPEDGTPRYHRIRPYAKGGLGEVFVAQDATLHREVALKRILPRFADDPHVRRRFLREVEITARLDHPGIAPIHELILDKHGRHWYVMRFVRGRTLRVEIERYYAKLPTADETVKVLDFRNMLGRFVSVCETIAYAHRRGFVHRDLTPANIMLGDYNETIVLDWGFATASGDPEGNGEVHGVSSPPDASLMVSGKLFGTPAFMSPEQAAGHQSAVGPRSDVYCLGAIFYMLLTGRAPFQGSDVPTILKKIQDGDLEPARRIRGEVPAALEAICLKAMRLDPDDRYPDARSLANEIQRWLGDERVAAYREPIRLRARRWARRHKTELASIGAALLVAGLAGLAFGFNQINQRWRTEAAVVKQLDKAERIAAQAREEEDRTKWHDAIKLCDEARDNIERVNGSAVLLGRVVDATKAFREGEDELTLKQELEDALIKGVEVRPDGHFDIKAKLDAYHRAFGNHGLDIDGMSTQAVAAKIREHRLKDTLIASLDDWIQDENDIRQYKLITIVSEADTDPRRIEFRKAIIERDVPKMLSLARAIGDKSQVGPLQLHNIGKALSKADRLSEAAEFLRDSRQVHRGDLWLGITLTNVYARMSPPEVKLAIPVQEALVSLRPEKAALRFNLGNLLRSDGQIDQAIAEYQRAVKLKAEYVEAHYGLGFAYSMIRDSSGTSTHYREAIEQFREALRRRPDFTDAHNAYIQALSGRNELNLALEEYREQIARNPKQAGSHYGLATTLWYNGDPDGAILEYQEAVKHDPKFGWAHHNLGNLHLHVKKDPTQAIKAHRKAVEASPELCVAHLGLADALTQSADANPGLASACEEAADEYRRAIKLKYDLWQAHAALGKLLKGQAKFSEALAELKLGRDLAASQKQDAPVAAEIAILERFIAFESRLPALLKGDAKPANVEERLGLGELCFAKKMYASAAQFWADAFAADPKTVESPGKPHRYNAACAAAQAGMGNDADSRPDESLRSILRGQALGWLKDELEAYKKQLGDRSPDERESIAKSLEQWKKDTDLDGVRGGLGFQTLSRAERETWHSLWDEVETVVATARGTVRH
jgi:serine/threonine protein kinase/predicted Zn-dependent protease